MKHHFNLKEFVLSKEELHRLDDRDIGNLGYTYDWDHAVSSPLDDNTWYGAKFVVRTIGSGDPRVLLQGYKDETDGKDGGEWKKTVEITDSGQWNTFPAYLQGPSCLVRTDGVTDFRIKRLSIRTIEPPQFNIT